MNKEQFTEFIKSFDFKNLFINLGWDNFNNILPIAVDDMPFELKGMVEKRGFVIMLCSSAYKGEIPLSNIRKKIERQICKYHQEHLIIYTDDAKTKQIWQYVVQEKDKPKRVREIPYNTNQDPESLYQRARGILFTLDEEEKITLVDVTNKFKDSFGKNTEKVTKKFYTEFKKHHTVFLDFIEGIDDVLANIDNKNKQWYASLMLNRLMFCYFIQKRGYLDNNLNYLQDKLKNVKQKAGKNQFYSFYREFLLQLFHQGLGQSEKFRKLTVELGKIPYLNGGLFDVHELEKQFPEINIKDNAFKKIFNFFDQWNWHLDTSVEATGKDINPDVIGYIFEKYINDRAAMGAYYTKEDITDYIGKNTIITFLFDKVKKDYPKAFKPDTYIWTHLKNSEDTYIYDAVKKGIKEATKDNKEPQKVEELNIPENVAIGLDTAKPDLLERRKNWNTKTPNEFALPTEIWRETIERWKRYFEIKLKIKKGEISEINDFITYNLNIRQFIQDILENMEDPDLIRYFFKAILSITVLDPTCGSGAFLFAALNILEPLYEACIERMEQFTAEESRKYKFFHEVLAEVNSQEHPNLQYYIYKSIILNNLYGVDIMHEAVEIAKLRLFLKMVGAVDIDVKKSNFGLEPLPDIDFNIRVGNTLVGFATEEELKTALMNDPNGQIRMGWENNFNKFDEQCKIVSKTYKHFQDSQMIVDKGEESHHDAKQELQKRLDDLNDNLNEYLASTYSIIKYEDMGGNTELIPTENRLKQHTKQYDKWLESHQPFHWFAEFYEIINNRGGFDVVIGNPPYVEYSSIKKKHYSINKFITEKCGNLYTYVIEITYKITRIKGYIGFIVQLPIVCTDRMKPIQKLCIDCSQKLWFSNFDDRPGKLFDGLEHIRASILLSCKKENIDAKIYSTIYNRWYSENREQLFSLINYSKVNNFILNGSIPKIGNRISTSIFSKINKSQPLSNFLSQKANQYPLYYHNAPQYFIRAMKSPPYFRNKKNGECISGHVKIIFVKQKEFIDIVITLLNSSFYYWWFILHSNCRDFIKREIETIPISVDTMTQEKKIKLRSLCNILIKSYDNNKTRKEIFFKNSGKVIYDEYYPKSSKHIIDKIDIVIAEHYGFTEEELDFIINYDIKYRMGKELFKDKGAT